jgi:hypothetical protein
MSEQVGDELSAQSRLTVVYSRQSRTTGAHFSSCEAQYEICKETADSMGWPVHDHFLDEGESSETLSRDRLAEMRAALKQRGKRVAGQIPFGYITEGDSSKLVPDPENSVVIRDMFALASQGSKPSDIVSIANIGKWKDRYGNIGRWTTTRILKLLSNRTYVGEIRDGESFRPGDHVPLVARDVFDRVQEHIAERQTRTPGRSKRRIELRLIDVLVCGLCDRPMTSSYSRRGNIRYIYYRCRSQAGGRPPCANVSVSAYQLEEFICQTMCALGDGDPGFLVGFSKIWQELPRMEQLNLLPTLVSKVVYDPVAGTVDMEFNENEIETFRNHREDASS